jgi:hypothetical protein
MVGKQVLFVLEGWLGNKEGSHTSACCAGWDAKGVAPQHPNDLNQNLGPSRVDKAGSAIVQEQGR